MSNVRAMAEMREVRFNMSDSPWVSGPRAMPAEWEI